MDYQPPPSSQSAYMYLPERVGRQQDTGTWTSTWPQRHGLDLLAGSIDMAVDPLPIFGNADSTSTLQSDVPDQSQNQQHPLLADAASKSGYGYTGNDDGDGRAAFSTAANNNSSMNKRHKRGDTFEPLPFRSSEEQQNQMHVHPRAEVCHHHPEPVAIFYLSSPPPSASHSHQAPTDGDDAYDRGHRKVPSFVTPLRGYGDAMPDDDKASAVTAKHMHPYDEYHTHHGYHHHRNHYHGYYPPYHLWQHQPHGGVDSDGQQRYGQQYMHHDQPPPAPPIFHPLTNGKGTTTSKRTIKRRYFQDDRHDDAFATPTPAPAPATNHRPPLPLPACDPIPHCNEIEAHHQRHGNHAVHRRGPSVVFDNDEDWHQQSPTVLYRSWSTGIGESSAKATASVWDDESDVPLGAPKRKAKTEIVARKKAKKKKSKHTILTSTGDNIPAATIIDMSNNSNIDIPSAADEERDDEDDDDNDEEDIPVSDLDIGLPMEPLVNFQKMMKSSEETQTALEKWDKKMGLKRSHSKTMWVSTYNVGCKITFGDVHWNDNLLEAIHLMPCYIHCLFAFPISCISQDSDRSRQKLQTAILRIQRAKTRQMSTTALQPSETDPSLVANGVADDEAAATTVTEASNHSPVPGAVGVNSKEEDNDVLPLSQAEPSPARIVLTPN